MPFLQGLAYAILAPSVVLAQLDIPSDGSDGALHITEDTVIDLSKAVPGRWDDNNSGNAGKGIYDAEKWAVVFKYSSVTIDGHIAGDPAGLKGRTLRFINHKSRAPVVWLVQGRVIINGKLDLTGANEPGSTVARLVPAEPGPGGFRGGAMGPLGFGSGYGPGGGDNTRSVYNMDGKYASVYGNPQIIPLIGGSGSASREVYGGAAGGGAILIASGAGVEINGLIDASGGHTFAWWGDTRGSGGAIRIIAPNIEGHIPPNSGLTANMLALPNGRIRVEGQLSPAVIHSPETVGVAPASPPIIWPPANAPKAKILSVDSTPPENADDPSAPLVAAADIAIENNNPVNILIETRDFPIEGVVQLAVVPKFGERSWFTATRVGGNISLATWQVTTVLPQGFTVLQVRATQP